MTPLSRYQKDLTRPEFLRDSAQENAVRHLDDLYHRLVERASKPRLQPKRSIWPWKKAEPVQVEPEKGLYLWGGVGRGKTYLMDTFFECLPFERKTRMHFHRFMHRVHHELGTLEKEPDPLKTVADRFAAETDVLCFDEFFVSDITDAMILGTLMQELFARGITLVATSNIIPDELYRNGLQRARFMPAIALLNQHCEVLNVDAGVDYRLRTLEQAEIYHHPLDEQAEKNLIRYFDQLADEPKSENKVIEINNRPMTTRHEADGVVHFSFRELCDSPRSQNDYMELARLYHTILLSDVPKMGEGTDDAARRFIAMVDEFYERHVKLIISAEVAMDGLYTDGRLTFEFRRCCSRLIEMQSHDYLALEHLP
ncbi:cell division protein ZapE [Parasalinivibrio latis]|uniref:cell division protein ZapE n=1 Tax=Parasalinivibrio latis TaxID=2952610 RepID=UPI0030DFF1B7